MRQQYKKQLKKQIKPLFLMIKLLFKTSSGKFKLFLVMKKTISEHIKIVILISFR